MTGIGVKYVTRLSHELDWYSLKRHILLKIIFDTFGHADVKKLRLLRDDPKSKIDEQTKQLIDRFIRAEKNYKSLRWRLHAALFSASGGAIGLATLLGMHVNRHPVRDWRKGIEATASE